MKAVSGIMVTLLLVSRLTLAFNIQLSKAEPMTWTVDDDGPADFHTIQEAINAANPGDTIYVYNGTYYENVVVNRTVSLVGENRETTIIDGGGTGIVVQISTDNVHITGFTIQDGSWGGINLDRSVGSEVHGNIVTKIQYLGHAVPYGIALLKSNHTTVSNNIITHCYGIVNEVPFSGYGIWLLRSQLNIISNNRLSGNYEGIWSTYSSNNIVSGNLIMDNYNYGIGIGEWLEGRNDTIIGNTVVGNKGGITIGGSNFVVNGNNVSNNEGTFGGISGIFSESNITGNTVANNYFGIAVNGDNNIFSHNNFIDNTEQVHLPSWSINIWDDGYPSGGNYWSDYAGQDLNGNGIGDTPYSIDANNTDNYPLMGPVNAFDAGTWNNIAYSVDVASNSTVSDFYFNPDEGPFIRVNVTGSYGTIGFCRVAIPKQLLSVNRPEEWIVMVGDKIVVPGVSEDENYTYLYFTYDHSIKTVTITGTRGIPEFPTWAPILLILISLSIAIVVCKRRLLKAPIR